MAKLIEFEESARNKVMSGAKKVYDAVSVTLGPGGRNVMIAKKFDSPVITKDGVTVAKEVILKDPFENAGAQMIISGVSNSNDKVGDGSTTATVLAYSIAKEGIKNISKGANPIEIKRGIDKAVNIVVDGIKSISKEVSSSEDIKAIATISANNDEELGSLVAEAFEKVGKDGTIVSADSKTMETTVKVVDGMKFDNGYLSSYFVTDTNNQITEYQDPYILVTDKSLSNAMDLLPILEAVAKSGKPLLIICDNVETEAMTALIVNNMRGVLKSCAVKAPGYGDARNDNLQDIAILTGASIISDKFGRSFKNTTIADLGKCTSVKVTKDETTLVGGLGDKEKINERVAELKTKLENEVSTTEKDALQTRIGKLAGGVAVIELGAVTETELNEKKFRLEDTLNATRAAVEEGILPGGGTALVKASEILEYPGIKQGLSNDEVIGFNIIKDAIKLPLKRIAENTGVSGEIILNEVINKNSKVKIGKGIGFNSDSNEFEILDTELFGYNARTGKYEQLRKTGVVDPTKVVRTALQNAASTASAILTTECIIVDDPEEKKE